MSIAFSNNDIPTYRQHVLTNKIKQHPYIQIQSHRGIRITLQLAKILMEVSESNMVVQECNNLQTTRQAKVKQILPATQ
jgi:hypothetical protein